MRFPNRAGIIVAACLFAVAVPSASSALERPVTLEEAVKAALEHSPKSRMSQLAVEKARDIRNGSLGPMFPNVTIDAGLQYWDDDGHGFPGVTCPDDELAARWSFCRADPGRVEGYARKAHERLSKMRNYQVADRHCFCDDSGGSADAADIACRGLARVRCRRGRGASGPWPSATII